MSSQSPKQERFVYPSKGGVAGEVGDLRQDVENELAPMAAIAVEEYIDPLATAADNMTAATTSQTTEDVLLPDATPAVGVLTQATIDNMALDAGGARQLLFTVAGGTPAHRAPTATVYGTNIDGKEASEVLPLPDVAGTALTGTFFSSVERVVLAAGSGAGATVAIGLGALLGLGAAVRSRAGRVAVIQEVAAGSVVTNGVVTEGAEVAASDTGTADLSTGGTLGTETLIVEMDGVVQPTVTFATPGNTAAVVAAIEAIIPGIASDDGADHLVLTSLTTGPTSSLALSGTSLTKLGITAGSYQGTDGGKGTYAPNSAPNGATSYALYYEYDPAA